MKHRKVLQHSLPGDPSYMHPDTGKALGKSRVLTFSSSKQIKGTPESDGCAINLCPTAMLGADFFTSSPSFKHGGAVRTELGGKKLQKT